jgi:hypothetical protein
MSESYFLKTVKRNVASALLTAGVEAIKKALYQQKDYITHSGNLDDAYACAVYYGGNLAYGVDGNACIAYANTSEEDYDIYFTKNEDWNDYNHLNTNDKEILSFFTSREGAKETAFKAAKGQGKMPPSALMTHDEFYGSYPKGYGRNWAYEYAKEKERSFPNDKRFRLVVFNAAFYAPILEDNKRHQYKVLTCVLSDAVNEVDKIISFVNQNSDIRLRRQGGVSINKTY